MWENAKTDTVEVTFLDGVDGEAFADQTHTAERVANGNYTKLFEGGDSNGYPTREGYEFNGRERSSDNKDLMKETKVTYIAKWEKVEEEIPEPTLAELNALIGTIVGCVDTKPYGGTHNAADIHNNNVGESKWSFLSGSKIDNKVNYELIKVSDTEYTVKIDAGSDDTYSRLSRYIGGTGGTPHTLADGQNPWPTVTVKYVDGAWTALGEKASDGRVYVTILVTCLDDTTDPVEPEQPEQPEEPKAEHTVTFDPANGEDKFTQTVTDGEKATKPADPARDGYTFAGWYDEDGNEYDFDAPVTGDITLTAHWTKNNTEPKPESKFSISVSKRIDGSKNVKPGDTVKYEVTITNTSEAPLWDLLVKDVAADGLTLNTGDTLSGTLNGKSVTLTAVAGEAYTWELPGEFPVDAVLTLKYSAKVSEDIKEPASLVNRAYARGYTSASTANASLEPISGPTVLNTIASRGYVDGWSDGTVGAGGGNGTREDGTAAFVLPMGDSLGLEVAVAVGDGTCEIVRWQTVYTGEWEPDEFLDLWEGF